MTTQQSTKQRLRPRLVGWLETKLNISIRRRKAAVWLLDALTPHIRKGGIKKQRLVKIRAAVIGRSGGDFRAMVSDRSGCYREAETNRDFLFTCFTSHLASVVSVKTQLYSKRKNVSIT